MNKKIVKIEPFFEARMWGGTRLKETFHYITDVHPIGEVYNVVALKNHADCIIPRENITLSALYETNPEWFMCYTKELPIRVNILDALADLSVQIHPNDAFAKKHNGGRGKPEAWVILDTPEDGYIEFGHTATTKEEFVEKVKNKDFKSLLKYLKAIKNAFIDIPSGTLHAIGKGVLTYNISRNADCTLRLFDYDRIDPSTGEKRQLHVLDVINEVNIPDRSTEFVMFPSTIENGCKVTRYWDEPGLYTSIRFQIEEEGTYEHPRFAFYTCVAGEGMVNDTQIRTGETILVPDGMGTLSFKGKLDLFLASYWNK
jgi:mannose-6-phosphate isomerase